MGIWHMLKHRDCVTVQVCKSACACGRRLGAGCGVGETEACVREDLRGAVLGEAR